MQTTPKQKNESYGYSIVISNDSKKIFDFSEFNEFKELFFFLAWRDILVRYKQSVLGVAWAVVRPLITMVIFSIIFGRVAGLASGGVPYAILVFSALLPWQFFADSFQHGSTSLITNAPLISKVYFPRAFIPASCMLSSGLDFVFSFSIFVLIMAYYHFAPSWTIVFLPLFVAWNALFVLGLNLLVSALNVRYRDFKHVVPFLIQIGIYVSPVGFSSSILRAKWRLIFSLNPLVGIIDGFRWALLGEALFLPGVFVSLTVTVLLFILGVSYFQNTQELFADVI